MGARQQLAELRKAAGFSQEALADRLGVHRDTVRGWERGDRTPHPRQRHPLAQALGVGLQIIDEIFTAHSQEVSDVDRRNMVKLLGGAAVAVAAARQDVAAHALEADLFDRFEAQRLALVNSDNLLGPHHAIPVARDQLNGIAALRRHASGRDRNHLVSLQVEYADLLGWLYQDAGDHSTAQYWLDRALEWSHTVDSTTTAFILSRKSQLAADMALPDEAVDTAEAAMGLADRGGRLLAVAATHAGHGYALRGDREACQRSYDYAYQLEQTDSDLNAPYGLFLDHGYIGAYEAHSYAVLGDFGRSTDIYDRAVVELRGDYYRDNGLYVARRAVAQAGAGDIDRASATGLQALAVGADTRSARIAGALAQLDGMISTDTEYGRAVAELRG